MKLTVLLSDIAPDALSPKSRGRGERLWVAALSSLEVVEANLSNGLVAVRVLTEGTGSGLRGQLQVY